MTTLTDGTVRFFKGLFGGPRWVLAWVAALGWIMMVGPLFYWEHYEARVVFATIMFSAIFMMWLTGRFGFVRLLGLGHALFAPLWAYLACRVGEYPADSPFGTYLWIVLGAVTISLVFDITDVVRYIRGERAETVVTN